MNWGEIIETKGVKRNESRIRKSGNRKERVRGNGKAGSRHYNTQEPEGSENSQRSRQLGLSPG